MRSWVPTVVYHGGGWLRYGFRHVRNRVLLVVALVALAGPGSRSRGREALILFRVLVNLGACIG